ncbi:LPS export ABC transporter periplasmic protein LptC [Deferrisoma sp.]
MRRGWVALGIAATLGAAWALVGRDRAPEKPEAPGTSRQERTVSRAEGIEIEGQEPDGRTWRLRAARAEGVEEDRAGRMEEVRVEIREPGRDPTEVAGAEARIAAGRTVSLAGGVAIRWAGYELRAEAARYDRSKARIEVPGRLEGRGPGVRLEGAGATVDLEARRARVRGPVRAVVGGGSR